MVLVGLISVLTFFSFSSASSPSTSVSNKSFLKEVKTFWDPELKTVFLWDWDDSLFGTTEIKKSGTLDPDLDQIDTVGTKLLTLSKDLGATYIITNANFAWILKSLEYVPKMRAQVKFITSTRGAKNMERIIERNKYDNETLKKEHKEVSVISALENYEEYMLENYMLQKKEENDLGLSDGDDDETMTQETMTAIRPGAEVDVDIMKAISRGAEQSMSHWKPRVFSEVIRGFRNQLAEGEKINIVVIGDGDFEMKAANKLQKDEEFKDVIAAIKTVQLVAEPTVDLLVQELEYLKETGLGKVVQDDVNKDYKIKFTHAGGINLVTSEPWKICCFC